MRATRDKLLSLLSEACEIEHSLACAYLYAAFSLKQVPDRATDWRAQQLMRRWAGQIYFVASQEMLHLAQAWNLLAAIGGTPYFMRPGFPQPRSYWPLPAALKLERFSMATVERFVQWEAPAEANQHRTFTRWANEQTDSETAFRTVGELYDRIAEAIATLSQDDLFIGDAALQIGPDLADFPDLVRVTDRASAFEAIRRVQHQGEGMHADREDSHFGIFHAIREELNAARTAEPGFEPAHFALNNPSTRPGPGVNRVTDETTSRAMVLFNDIYVLTIRLLGWVFGPGAPGDPLTRAFARAGIGAMPVILKPLGEALARMPSGDGVHTAGASFALQRHVPLASGASTALRLVTERIDELTLASEELLVRPDLREDLSWLPNRLAWLRATLGGA